MSEIDFGAIWGNDDEPFGSPYPDGSRAQIDMNLNDPRPLRERAGEILARNAERPRKIGERRLSLYENTDREKRYNGTARAKTWLRNNGYQFERVDYFDARFNRAHDLLGMFDFLAFRIGETVGVQLTTINNVAARIKKIRADARLQWVLDAKWRVLVLGISENVEEIREEWIAPSPN